jgi:formamidopyrimidine-DNA glycosylase
MPELPEVETVVRGLSALLVGRRFTRVVARRPDLRLPLPADLGQRLTGAEVIAVGRRAKFGRIDTDRGDTLLFHLGMSGRFRPAPAVAGRHDHVRFETGDAALVYTDPRRFGFMDLAGTADLPRHRFLAGLGPEPLDHGFTGAILAEAFAGRTAPAKALLLDQRIVAGIGNIYAAEALFAARIDPRTPAGALDRPALDRLVAALKQVLAEAIAAGGSSLRDHARPSGEPGYFQHRFQVYGREGQPCPACGAPVERLVQGGRSTFFCRQCQTVCDGVPLDAPAALR